MSSKGVTGADLVVDSLVEAGIEYVFGVTGTSILSILDAMYGRKDIAYIGVRHEATAAFMADAYARVTGRPGVCMCHVGPGAAQLLYGVANAHKDSSPVIAITGNETSSGLGRDLYHEFDVMALYKPITKWSFQARSSQEIPRIIRNALIKATLGRPGPAHVDLPKDITRAPAEKKAGEMGFLGNRRVSVPLARINPDPEMVAAAASLLLKAERPTIVCGGGVNWSDASREVVRLAELLKAPVLTTETGRGSIPEDHPCALGSAGRAAFATKSANKALVSSDVILGVGWSFSDISTDDWKLIDPKARIIQVDVDPAEIGKQYPVTIGVVSDAKAFLGQLIPKLEAEGAQLRRDDSRLKELKDGLAAEREEFFSIRSPIKAGVKPQMMGKELMGTLNRDAFVAVDTGLHIYFASRLPIYTPRTYLRAGGFGAMGFSLAAVMSAKLAFPERQAVSLIGDGCFAMVMHELETAVRYNLPIVAIIFNNFSFGSQKLQQKMRFQERYIGSDHGNPDYAKIANLFGAHGERVERIEDLKPALNRALAASKPAVLDVILDTEESPTVWA